MTIARQAQRGAAKKVEPRVIDVSGMTLYKPPDATGRKHFNFMPKGPNNAKGGLYAD